MEICTLPYTEMCKSLKPHLPLVKISIHILSLLFRYNKKIQEICALHYKTYAELSQRNKDVCFFSSKTSVSNAVFSIYPAVS